MNGCEATCVLIIWLAFLWPIIVTSLVLAALNYRISHRVRYWFASVIIGYVAILSLPEILPIYELKFGMWILASLPIIISISLLRWHRDEEE
jgi:hypothetical protein